MAIPTKSAAASSTGPIRIDDIKVEKVQIPIRGITPLLPQAWTDTALQAMRNKQQQAQTTTQRAKKDPEANAHASTYWVSEGVPGIPAGAFKSSMISAVGLFKGLTKVNSKMLFRIEGEGPANLVPLLDAEWEPREFTVRNASGVADLRYFNVIFPWRALLIVSFPPSLIETSAVVSLVEAAGQFAGVGGYRPSAPKVSSGTYGCWEVER